MTTDTTAILPDDDDVLICEHEKRPRGAPSFLDLHDAITAVVAEDGALRVEFDPARRADVEQLAAAERLCCPTIGFDLSPPPALTLRIRATPGRLATLEQMVRMDPAEGGWS